MRVTIMMSAFLPDVIGRMQTQTKQIETNLSEAGHEITVATRRSGTHDDSDVVRVPSSNSSSRYMIGR